MPLFFLFLLGSCHLFINTKVPLLRKQAQVAMINFLRRRAWQLWLDNFLRRRTWQLWLGTN